MIQEHVSQLVDVLKGFLKRFYWNPSPEIADIAESEFSCVLH